MSFTTDLTAGYAAVISVEPIPDNSSDPFTLKPLLDGTIDDVGGGVLQSMANNAAASSPAGTVRLFVSKLNLLAIFTGE